MKKRQTGVTVGKFNPPHRGHVHLIRTGAAAVDHLYVILADRADQTISAASRARWLTDAIPTNTTVVVTPDDLPLDNAPWARRALEILPEKPTVAFTSETWGPGWAADMGATHVLVAGPPKSPPIRATQIREDMKANFHWMVPLGRAEMSKRIVVVGAESTGKTTLAKALAKQLQTVWVPEYGRHYWEGRRFLEDQGWTGDEFCHIATTHHAIGDELARRSARGAIVYDSDALTTAVWHRRYLGSDSPALEAIAKAHQPDLYLVCTPDFDWVQDGTRESKSHRAAMHDDTLRRVKAAGAPFAQLHGPPRDRLEEALRYAQKTTAFPQFT